MVSKAFAMSRYTIIGILFASSNSYNSICSDHVQFYYEKCRCREKNEVLFTVKTTSDSILKLRANCSELLSSLLFSDQNSNHSNMNPYRKNDLH